MIEIEVKLHGFLGDYLPEQCKGGIYKMQLNQPMSVTNVLNELKIPDKALRAIMVTMINREQAEMDQLLYDGDVLAVIPFAPGG